MRKARAVQSDTERQFVSVYPQVMRKTSSFSAGMDSTKNKTTIQSLISRERHARFACEVNPDVADQQQESPRFNKGRMSTDNG